MKKFKFTASAAALLALEILDKIGQSCDKYFPIEIINILPRALDTVHFSHVVANGLDQPPSLTLRKFFSCPPTDIIIQDPL